MKRCVFCEIVAGRAPCHKVWENDDFLAFLSICPNTAGTTVVIPKSHQPSYVFAAPRKVREGIMDAAAEVSKILEASFDDIGRVGVVFEGFGVDHLHAKLFPLHGTRMGEWRAICSELRTFFDTYPGYISSHDGDPASHEQLALLAQRIREGGK